MDSRFTRWTTETVVDVLVRALVAGAIIGMGITILLIWWLT